MKNIFFLPIYFLAMASLQAQEVKSIGFIGASNTVRNSYVDSFLRICPEYKLNETLFVEAKKSMFPHTQAKELLPKLLEKKVDLLVALASGNGLEKARLGFYVKGVQDMVDQAKKGGVKWVAMMTQASRLAKKDHMAATYYNQKLFAGEIKNVDFIIDSAKALHSDSNPHLNQCGDKFCDKTGHFKKIADHRTAIFIYSVLFLGEAPALKDLPNSNDEFEQWLEKNRKKNQSCRTLASTNVKAEVDVGRPAKPEISDLKPEVLEKKFDFQELIREFGSKNDQLNRIPLSQ